MTDVRPASIYASRYATLCGGWNLHPDDVGLRPSSRLSQQPKLHPSPKEAFRHVNQLSNEPTSIMLLPDSPTLQGPRNLTPLSTVAHADGKCREFGLGNQSEHDDVASRSEDRT